MKIYELMNDETCEIVGYTILTGLETDDDNIAENDVLDERLENAIYDGRINQGLYSWSQVKKLCKYDTDYLIEL